MNPGVSGLGDRSGRTENGDAETTDVDRRELVPKDDGRNKDDGDLLEDASDGAENHERLASDRNKKRLQRDSQSDDRRPLDETVAAALGLVSITPSLESGQGEHVEAHPNSVTFMAKASMPGSMMDMHVLSVSPSDPQNSSCEKTFPQPSKMRLHNPRVAPMIGASQNKVAIGLPMPIDSLWRSIWVSDQRKPPRAEAERTWIMPTKSNWVSVETIRMTPAVMMRMMPASRQEGLSRRNRKAKRRTNAREEDLHMAERGRRAVSSPRQVGSREQGSPTDCRRRA